MEGTAVLGRLSWRVATIADVRPETPRAKTLELYVDGWPGHLPGQHVDIRLTAEDGYQAERSYSIASPPGDSQLELTVEHIDDGEVSPYLTEDARLGDQFELRGPIGGYFVWDGKGEQPVLLVAGGYGLVPLMAMLRNHREIGSRVETRLLVSARTLDEVLYREELDSFGAPVTVHVTLTRGAPSGWDGLTGRIDRQMLTTIGQPPAERPAVYVCGPTPFVEAAASLLVGIGHAAADVRTERFGPSGG